MKHFFIVRYFFITLISVLIIFCSVEGQNTKVNLDSGLIACYPFNGNANDESGNGNNGTVYGSTLTTDRFGNPNSSYHLNGVDNYIILPNTIKLFNSFCLCFWVQTQRLNTYTWPSGDFILDRDICFVNQDWSVGFGNGGKIQYNTGTNSADFTLTSTTNINDNIWKFVVIIMDATFQRKSIFINAVLDNFSAFNNAFFNNNNLPISVGASVCYPETHTYFNGNIDDIRIYNRALNDNEIQMLYNLNVCCKGEYPFVNLGKDTTICNNCTLKLHAGKGFAKYLWQDGSADSLYTVTSAGKYWVQFSNIAGCTASDTINISVKIPPQKVICDFDVPDTVCVNQSINIINKSIGASNYFWNFCTLNVSTTPKGGTLTSQGNLNWPHFITVVKDGSDYYTFNANETNGTITRNYFGKSLLNAPVSANLGYIGQLLVSAQIKKENGNWYGFSTTTPSGTGSLLRLEFGASLLNTPKIIDLGNIGNLNRPQALLMVKDSGNWFGFALNTPANTITEFQFGNSLTNIPKGINYGNIGSLNVPAGIAIWKEDNNWYFMITNANSNTLTRLDFGNSLFNIPKATNLGTISSLHWSNDIKFFKDCSGLHAFIVNAGGSNTLSRIDFNNGIKGSITGTSLGNIGNLVFPVGMTDILSFGDTLCAVITNRDGNTLSRIYFPVCNNPPFPSTNLMNPPPVSYNKPGVYTISLTIDEGLPTQNTVCKNIIVSDSLKNITISDNEPVCEGGVLNLYSNPIPGASYQWLKNGNNIISATNSSFNIQHSTLSDGGTYTLFVSLANSCNNKASATSKVIIVNPLPHITLGKDTSICSGSSVTLSAKGTNVSTFRWTKNSIFLQGATSINYQLSTINYADSGTYTCIATNTCKSVTSNTMLITVNSPPVISFFTPPTIKCSRDSIMFKVRLQTSDFGLQTSYQWKRKGNNIPNSTKSSYIISVITPIDTGKYYCYVSNICGDTSAYTTLSINTPPFIPDTTLNLTSCKGESVTFAIHPTGTNLSYQWTKLEAGSWKLEAGATNSTFKIQNLTFTDNGTYSCTVSNSCRTTSAVIATLNINNCTSVSGKVTYDNAANTPITKSVVYLENSQGRKLDSATTDITGAYKINNISNGKYFLLGGKTDMKWGGCNPVDALTVNRYYVGLIKTFGDAIRKAIADVNNDGKINPSDALTINWRYVGLIKKFSIPDWLYESHTVMINDVSILQDIRAICAGDVNGSYPK
jgi:hypothetical protein